MEILHIPVWDRLQNRLEPVQHAAALIQLGFRMLGAYLTLALRLLLRLPRVDAVLIGYPGHLDVVVLGPLVRLFGKPLIYDPLVTLTDTLIEDRKLVPSGSLKGRLIRLIDRIGLRMASVVLADTEENAQYFSNLAGIPREKIQVTPVGADENLFSPRHHRDSLPSWPFASSQALRVLFYGTYIPLHGPETIIRAAKILGKDRAVFTMVGRGQLWASCRELAQRLGVDNVHFIPWIPYHELPAWIASADVVLGIFGDTPKAARVVPNKVYQAMAMGAAIVTRNAPPVQRILEDRESAVLVPPANPEALAEAIEWLMEPQNRARLGKQAYNRFVQYASLDAIAQRLSALCLRRSSPLSRSGSEITGRD